MAKQYKYIIAGGGLAGASAIEGIREFDKDGLILLVGKEKFLPYHRPPISKSLWFGKKKPQDVFVYDENYYVGNGVDVLLGIGVTKIDARDSTIICESGESYKFEKLLIATGGIPRRLNIPGGNSEAIFYYRDLADYHRLKALVHESTTVLVIGGGFIGSEMAAALNHAGGKVTLLQRDEYMVKRVFPESLGRFIEQDYVNKGVTIISGDGPIGIEQEDSRCVTHTKNGKRIESDIVVAGIGIEPEIALARSAGLEIANGIFVNEFLATSNPNIYAAGDNAFFPYQVFDSHRRVEHWDNALNQGKYAGWNMAGQLRSYDYMPYFFSDLFDFGYEAVGQVDSRLEFFADWQEENKKGVIYYLDDGMVSGVMLCNVWEHVDWARDLIRRREPISKGELSGLLSAKTQT